MARYIDADKLVEMYERAVTDEWNQKTSPSSWADAYDCVIADIDDQPTADVVEVKKVAEILRTMFDDDSACNYNGIDEWLPMKCKYAETDCPMPKERLGCWKEFVKHFLAKMDGRRDT